MKVENSEKTMNNTKPSIATDLQRKLKTKILGKSSFHYRVIDSTQKEIWRRINANSIANGTLVYADIQTAGIGTHGRNWYTDEEDNIAFSIFMKLQCGIEKLYGLTVEIAETIVNIFKELYGIILKIKEPNDIYCNGKKIGGILTETKVCSSKAKYVVVGIGINTNKSKFSEDIKNIATSILEEFGVRIGTVDFIAEFCNRFEEILIERVR